MTDDDRAALARADRARLILADEMVVQALADMRTAIREAWETSPARDTEGREHLHRYMRVIGQFEGCLKRHLETGQIIKSDIEREEAQKSLLARAKERIYG